MNQQLSKSLRQFAKYRMLPYKAVKRAWDRSSKQEQLATLPEIKKVITMGKDADRRHREKQNDQTENNQ